MLSTIDTASGKATNLLRDGGQDKAKQDTPDGVLRSQEAATDFQEMRAGILS
jgi:hypothetical protein